MVKTIRITTGGKYHYQLDKMGQKLEVIGRFRLRGEEKLELTIEVVHMAENTAAQVSLKATVDDKAQALIRGRVIVERTAKNTDSFLEERVLLLSAEAKAVAVPDLEIKTNEVKCSHAATIGAIYEEQLFYLNSRGIPKAEAKQMIAEGFLL